VQLLALKFGDAAMVTAWAPFPAGAVKVNVQELLAVEDVWGAGSNAPLTSTHFVSDDVVTVSVRAPPCFA
jgi:hypothetical protein